MWKRNKGPKEPYLDPTFGDPHLKALIRALEKRNWKHAGEFFGMAADPDELAFLMEGAGGLEAGVDGLQDWIGDWIAAEPGATLLVALERFEAVTRLHPGHVVAHEQRLQYLCAKWSGSREEMFAFARGAAAAAGPDSLPHVLVAAAHIENWHNTEPREEADEYIVSAEVRAELLTAAENSIFHPDYIPAGPGWAPRVSTFAAAFELADEFDAAWRAFSLLDGLVTPWPWMMHGDPLEKYTSSRNWVNTNRS